MISPVTLTHVNDRSLWTTATSITYISPRYGFIVSVPVGFETDLASIPRCVWWLIPRDDRHIVDAAVVHDYLYKRGITTRATADMVLRDITKEQGAPYWYRCVVWVGVRLFGGKAWNTYRLHPLPTAP